MSLKHLGPTAAWLFWVGCQAPAPLRVPLPAAAPPVALCAALHERNRPHLELLRAFHEETAKTSGPPLVPDPTLQALDFCMATPSGAWALSLESLRRGSPDGVGVVGRWVIAHLAPDGSRVTVAPALPDGQSGDVAATAENFSDLLGDAHLSIQPPQLHDYDRDGEPELIVQIDGHIHEGGSWHRGRVWTFRQGVVALYAPAANLNIRDVQDVDRDGQPDLWTVGPFEATAQAPGAPYELTGPRLVAHARADGTFALDDGVARAMAHKVCPTPPRRLIVKRQETGVGESLDLQATAINVVCARLWGVPGATLRTQIQRECPETDNPNLSCDRDALLKLAAVLPLPLELQKTAPLIK